LLEISLRFYPNKDISMKKVNFKNPWLLAVLSLLFACAVLLSMNMPTVRTAMTQISETIFGIDGKHDRNSVPTAQAKEVGTAILGSGGTSVNINKNAAVSLLPNKATSLLDRYPLPHKYPVGMLVGMEISKAEDEFFKRRNMLFANQKLGDAYRIFLPGAQAGDADSMWELSNILRLCDAPDWRGGGDSPRLEQCKGVPENSHAEALRLRALAAREGNLVARNSMLYFNAEPSGYTAILAADPVLNSLVQQEILASLQFFTTIPESGYIQRGYNVYSDGVVPPNLGLAAAYTLASYSLQKSNFPEDTDSSIHKANFVAQAFDKISPSQHAYAIRKAQEILNICCGGIAPVTNFSKFRKP
jgi:hypothetical protein